MKKLWLIASFVVTLYSSQQLSIQQAWEILEQNNAAIKAQQDSILIAKAKKKSTKSLYLPTITLTGSYTYFDEPLNFDLEANIPFLGTLKKNFEISYHDMFLVNIHMLYPLYTGGKIDAANEIAASALNEQKALQEMQKDKEFLKLVKYYYGVVVASSLYQTRVAAQKALKLHYQNAKKLFEQGQIAKVELLHAKVELDNATIDMVHAKNKLIIAQKALENLLGMQIEPQETLDIKKGFISKEQLQIQMEQNNASLALLKQKQKQSTSLVKIKKAAYHPQLLGYADYNIYKDDSITGQTLPKWFAGVMVKIDILKNQDRAQELQIAKLTQQKIRHLKEETLHQLELLLEKTYQELLGAKKEYELLASSKALAKENYNLRVISFEAGLSTSSDVVDAQKNIIGAQTKQLNAAYVYIQKLALLYVLSGERERFFQ